MLLKRRMEWATILQRSNLWHQRNPSVSGTLLHLCRSTSFHDLATPGSNHFFHNPCQPSINIAGPDHDNFHSVLFHFNPRHYERGGQLVLNNKQEGMWGQAINGKLFECENSHTLKLAFHRLFIDRYFLVISVPLSTVPLIFGQTSCTLVIQINGEGFDVFLNEKHIARLEHRRELASGKNSLFLNFPSTDDYNSKYRVVHLLPMSEKSQILKNTVFRLFLEDPENWMVYKVRKFGSNLGISIESICYGLLFVGLASCFALGVVGKQTISGQGRSVKRCGLQELQLPAPSKFHVRSCFVNPAVLLMGSKLSRTDAPLAQPFIPLLSTFSQRKLFISKLPKIHTDPEVDLRRAELERAFRKYGGDRGVSVIVPKNNTFAFVEMESERQADLALSEMATQYRINRARRTRHEALQEERAAAENKKMGKTKDTADWD